MSDSNTTKSKFNNYGLIVIININLKQLKIEKILVINIMVNLDVIDDGSPKAGPYNLGIKAGNLIFISGQVTTPEAKDIKSQTKATLEKIKRILNFAGLKVSNLVKITIFLKDISDFKEMNQAYKEFFEHNGVSEKFPARTTIEATCPLPYGLIEIEAIAVL